MKTKVRWNNKWYLECYLLARSGLQDNKISEALGMSPLTFKKYRLNDEALKDVLDKGRGEINGVKADTFVDYVYERLSPDIKVVWDKISRWENIENGISKIEEILQEKGVRVRQQLWVHSLIHCGFDASKACKKVNIPFYELKKWTETDPKFGELLEEIKFWKANFFESALIDSVRGGEASTIIFANRTWNKDRGYDDSKRKLEVGGTVEHKHTVEFDPNEIPELPIEALRMISDHLRKKQEALSSKPKEIIDVVPMEVKVNGN